MRWRRGGPDRRCGGGSCRWGRCDSLSCGDFTAVEWLGCCDFQGGGVEFLFGEGELFPGVASEAGFPGVEVGYVEDGAVFEFQVGPVEGERDGGSGAGAGAE